jgi:hypothetical protein
MKYDIFISYRRENGDQIAKAVYDRLRDKGYNVYLDVETLHSGAFNEKLYSVIDECRDVLVILSPNALDRCVNDNDWVRLEVAHAIRSKKNIIPVMLRDFDFPPELPADITVLRYQNGIHASAEFFDAFMEKLYRLLKSKPGIISRFFTSLSWRRALIAIGVFILLISSIWGGSVLIKQEIVDKTLYPFSSKEKNDVRNMLYYVHTNLTVADNMISIYQDALTACEDYLHEPEGSSYQALVSRLQHQREIIKKQLEQAKMLKEGLSKAISDTKINIADLTALSQFPKLLFSEYDQTFAYLEYAMNPANPLDNATRYRIIAINRDLAKLDAQSLLVGTCQLLLPIDEKALKEFRTEHLPLLSVISKELHLWSRDETDLTGKEKNIATQQQNLMTEYAALVGNQNMELQSAKKTLRELKTSLVKPGTNIVNDTMKPLASIDPLEEKKKELADAQKRLEEKKQSAREKFAPQDTDDPYLLWGKALRFLRIRMYDESVNVFQFYLNKVKDTDTEARVYVPAAINFVRSIGKTGIDYGVLVVGYEPGKPRHPVYKVGDIVIAINKTVCRDFADYDRAIKSIPVDSNFGATILRPDETGTLRMIDVELQRSGTKVAFMNLKEAD